MEQIIVKHLEKVYTRKKGTDNILEAVKGMFGGNQEYLRAVDDISFSIRRGEAVGYVGPNGSGKSTTIKMLCGILKPSGGSIQVNGIDPFEKRIENSRRIGVVFGNRSLLWWDVPVIESFRLFQRLYEIPKSVFEENLEKYIQIMGIKDLLHVPERQLSLGQKMRCNIAGAFLHNPEIIYLDEPTIGLDSESKARIRECIQKINEEEKTTFIVTSHDFQDIESLCRRIILINHGKIVVDGEMQKVKLDFNEKKQIQFEMDANPWKDGRIFDMDGVRLLRATPYSLLLEYDVEITDSFAIMQKVSQRCEIQDVTISGRDIESIVREIIKKDNKENQK